MRGRGPDLKTYLEGFVIGTLVLTLAMFLLLETGTIDIRADVVPSPLTSRFLDVATHASVLRKAPALESPLSDDEQVLIAGGKLFLDDCVGCHGEPGKPSRFGASFYPPAPQFSRIATRYTEAQIVWIAKYGIRRSGTGAHGDSYSDMEYRELAAFIGRMTQLPPHVLEAIKSPAIQPSSQPETKP